MKWYPWLRPAFEKLSGQYQAGHGHPALLIHAIPGMGEDALCYALARLKMCQSPQGNKSCGQCRGCKLMQAGTHPDYTVVVPEKGKQNLGIDVIRDVTDKLYNRASLGGAKVVWIKDVTLLTEAAANALLKTLEEPPEHTWFLMACHEPDKLLPTLRSRCFHFSLGVPDEPWAQAWLQRESGSDTVQCLAALRLSCGAPAAALSLLQPDNAALRNKFFEQLTQALNNREFYSLLAVMNQERATDMLWWFSTLLVDALKLQQHAGQSVMNVDRLLLVEQLVEFPGMVLQAICNAVFQLRAQLLAVPAINRELLLAEQLLAWEHYLQPGAPLPSIHL
jgi:DNA polymerase-3 subunit delta'